MKTLLESIKNDILNMETITEEELNKIFESYNIDDLTKEDIINYLLNDYQEEKEKRKNPSKDELDELDKEKLDEIDEKELINAPYSGDSVKEYLKEIGKIPLLSADEERLLFLQIEKARKEVELSESLQEKEINEEKLTELEKKAANHNLRLVVSIAKGYLGHNVDFLDLIQEGNLGLMKAIDKFEVSQGYKFSTYATWWIRQSITRAIADKSRTVRIPVHMYEQVYKFMRTEKALAQELQREPNYQELADELQVSVEKIKDLKGLSQSPVSLQSPVGEEEDTLLIDFIEDDKSNLEDDVEQSILRTYLDKFLNKELTEDVYSGTGNEPGKFSDRELEVLKLRYGFNEDNKPHTLEEVGEIFGVTRERIRQIQAKAERKLKAPTNKVGKHIKAYKSI